MIFDIQLLKVGRQDFLRKTGLFLIQVHGNEVKIDRGTFLEIHQNIQHRIGVFAPRQADHDAVALFNHVVVFNGLAHVAAQPLLQLVSFGFLLFREFSHVYAGAPVEITDYSSLNQSRIVTI